MMLLKLTVYKESGKYYTEGYVSNSEDIPIYDERFPKYIYIC